MSALTRLEAARVVRHHGVEGRDPQQPCDVAVVMPTILRPSIVRAVDSIFAQRFRGTIQVLLGIDGGRERLGLLDGLVARRPGHVAMTIVDPGYSTSSLRGGFHGAYSGGALHTILSYTANAARLAHLDDDNWWGENHLAALSRAIAGWDWAFSHRLFVAADGRTVLHRDIWESLGPGAGTYVARFGGFCDTNTLMIDKTRADMVLRLWSHPFAGSRDSGKGNDRNVFNALRTLPHGSTDEATVYYVLHEADAMYTRRIGRIRKRLKAGFDGYDAYRQGRFADAAEDFGRLALVSPEEPDLRIWHEIAARRAGLAPADGASALEAVPIPADVASLPARDAGRLAFLAGARALLGDDPDAARAWYRLALAHGRPRSRAVEAARADLRRLDAVRPGGPRSAR